MWKDKNLDNTVTYVIQYIGQNLLSEKQGVKPVCRFIISKCRISRFGLQYFLFYNFYVCLYDNLLYIYAVYNIYAELIYDRVLFIKFCLNKLIVYCFRRLANFKSTVYNCSVRTRKSQKSLVYCFAGRSFWIGISGF